MSVRLFSALVATCFAMPATAATVDLYDVVATLTQHNIYCSYDPYCVDSEEGELNGLFLNDPVRATLKITDYVSGGINHQRYSLSYFGGGFGDTTENYNLDTQAQLSWNGENGTISYSSDRGSSGYYESARVSLATYVAPVPLPAGAFLLPAGIAALTVIRRRRKNA